MYFVLGVTGSKQKGILAMRRLAVDHQKHQPINFRPDSDRLGLRKFN